MASRPGHSRANSGHLPLGGSLLPSRLKDESDGASGSGMARTESNAPLLMNAPSLPSSQAFGALLEQARQVSGQLVGPNFHSLEIQTEPSEEPGPNKSWDNPPSTSRPTVSKNFLQPLRGANIRCAVKFSLTKSANHRWWL